MSKKLLLLFAGLALVLLIYPGVNKQQVKSQPVPNSSPESTPSMMVETSIDDDPVLGSLDAPVTIIEFSDYECPYCRQFTRESFPLLRSAYIDMGQVKFVYRDLPLLPNEPGATSEARAANCAREQAGDKGYFLFHDQIFATTKSTGLGLSLDELIHIAKTLKLNIDKFQACYASPRYDDEIKADYAEAERIGAKTTPTFVVGKTGENGNLEGILIEGASFSVLRTVIDSLLYENK